MKRNNNKTLGYSLMELLVVVAIIGILCAIAIPRALSYRKQLRQNELNAKAELIYNAVQNEISRLKIIGWESRYQYSEGSAAYQLSFTPSDDDGYYADDGETVAPLLYFITSQAADQLPNRNLMNDKVVDNELLAGHWVIEYDPQGGLVYSVFYSEDEVNVAELYESLTDGPSVEPDELKKLRTGKENGVGYYGGGGELASSNNHSLKLSYDIDENSDELLLNFRVTTPGKNDNPVVVIKLTDYAGNSYTRCFSIYGSTKMTYDGYEYDNTIYSSMSGRAYEGTLVLDSLSGEGQRFVDLYGENVNKPISVRDESEILIPGSDLKVEMYAVCPGNQLITPDTREFVTNPLFSILSTAPESTLTCEKALITCARHLQNLDSTSGVSENIKEAYILQDIHLDEDDTELEGFFVQYNGNYFNGTDTDGTPLFKPIENNNLTLLTSGNKLNETDRTPQTVTITGIVEDTYNDNSRDSKAAGLFGKVSLSSAQDSLEISYINLIGETLDAGTSAADYVVGGVVGKVTGSGKLAINNVQVYLSTANVDQKRQSMGKKHYTETEDFLFNGYEVGGLVGNVNGANVIITKSSASVLENAYLNAGGLIGNLYSGSAKLTGSYADCYITAITAGNNCFSGGLIGSNYRGNSVEMTDCYAAGFLKTTGTGAGLVGGSISKAMNVYTMLALESDTTPSMYYSTAAAIKFVQTKEVDNALFNTTVFYSESSPYENGNLSLTGTENNTAPINSLDGSVFIKEFYGGDFRISTVASSPYNLKDQGLSVYSYPSVNNLHHYGDWEAAFDEGSLIYYEQYLTPDGGSKWGFYGANVKSTLIDDPSYVVVGDGYGVVYEHVDREAAGFTEKLKYQLSTVTVDKIKNGSAGVVEKSVVSKSINYQSSSTVYYVVDDPNDPDVQYDIYPIAELTGNALHDTQAIDNFYYRVSVADSNSNKPDDDQTRYYFYNPDYAKTVVVLDTNDKADMPALTKNSILYVRTPRHFYELSRHYDSYYPVLGVGVTFIQERDVDYYLYKWSDGFTYYACPKKQGPIGHDADTPFVGIFNGNCNKIKNISFYQRISSNDAASYYVGLFGYNKGTIKNVVLEAEYDGENQNYFISIGGKLGVNSSLYMGILAGYNYGEYHGDSDSLEQARIENCAVCGYVMKDESGMLTGIQYTNMYLGCMVGYNNGSIMNSAVESPQLTLTNNFGNVCMGGFVGQNDGFGTIDNCYDVSYVSVADSRGGSVLAAGFAALNTGRINNSYCASVLAISGDTSRSFGFASSGGRVENCYYLNGGTYSFCGEMYKYEAEAITTSGKAKTYLELSDMRGSYYAPIAYKQGAEEDTLVIDRSKTYCYSYDEALYEEPDGYPFRAYVRDASGRCVHYGDWPTDQILGNFGVFYWEHEEGSGINSGYHFSYIGLDTKYEKETVTTSLSQGSSLCTVHNDGGVITEFGYGIYFDPALLNLDGNNSISINWDNIASSVNSLNNVPGESYNAAASQALAEQMKQTSQGDREFTFYAITTNEPNELTREGGKLKLNGTVYSSQSNHSTLNKVLSSAVANHSKNLSDYLYLDTYSGSGSITNVITEGTLTVSLYGKQFSFTISPFFADSFSYQHNGTENKQKDYSGYSHYDTTPGRTTPYSVRSYAQLQYINWNSVLKLSEFNFREADLQYINSSGWTIKKDIASDSDSYYKQENSFPYLEKKFASGAQKFSWVQSHDLIQPDSDQGSNYAARTSFVPIGQFGMPFAFSYDGGNYKVEDLYISSAAMDVGMFGYLSGTVSNVHMFSDGGNGLVESTYYSVLSASVGSLVGAARNNDGGKATITGCSSAGYTVRFNGTKMNTVVQSTGITKNSDSVEVGGLVGSLRNAVVSNSSACNTVTCVSSDSENFRADIGGLVGCFFNAKAANCSSSVVNCYSGGSVSSSATYAMYGGLVGNARCQQYDELNLAQVNNVECILNSGYSAAASTNHISDSYTYCEVQNCTNNLIYSPQVFTLFKSYQKFLEFISGLLGKELNTMMNGGKCYIAGNLDQVNENGDNVTIYDVYLGLIRTGPHDSVQTTVSNCYYLTRTGQAQDAYTRRYSGNITGLQYANFAGDAKDSLGLNNENALLNKLNKGSDTWSKVTTTNAQGTTISGYYSYPISATLQGQDYPFPAIVRQGHNYLHYGDWATNGPYWENSLATYDIFANESDTDAQGYQYVTYNLYDVKRNDATFVLDGLENQNVSEAFTYEPSEGKSVEVSSVKLVSTDSETKQYEVTFKVLKTGFTKVYPKVLSSSADGRLTVDVTANLNVTLKVKPKAGEEDTEFSTSLDVMMRGETSTETPTTDIVLAAASQPFTVLDGEEEISTTTDYTKNVQWNFVSEDDDEDGVNPYAEIRMYSNGYEAQITGYGYHTDYRVEAIYTYPSTAVEESARAQFTNYAHLYVTTDIPSTLGISNSVPKNTGTESYSQILMRLTDTADTIPAASTARPNNAPKLVGDDYSNFAGFIYYKRGDVKFKDVKIVDVKLSGTFNGEATDFGIYTGEGNYGDLTEDTKCMALQIGDILEIQVGSENESNSSYQYRPISVFYMGGVDNVALVGKELQLTLTLEQGGLQYTVSCPICSPGAGDVKKFITIHFDKGDSGNTSYQPNGTMTDVKISQGLSYTVPECGFSCDHFDFDIWFFDNGEEYAPGESINVDWFAGEETGYQMTVTAGWTAKQYQVILDYAPNNMKTVMLVSTDGKFSVSFPENGTYNGYEVYQWQKEGDSADHRVNVNATIDNVVENCTYKAVWAGTVTLEAQNEPKGGVVVTSHGDSTIEKIGPDPDQLVTTGSYKVILGDDFKLVGYNRTWLAGQNHRNFTGWSDPGSKVKLIYVGTDGKDAYCTDNVAGLIEDGKWVASNGNVTLYFTYDASSEITYVLNEGTITPASGDTSYYTKTGAENADKSFRSIAVGKTIDYPNKGGATSGTISRSTDNKTYEFQGWFTDSSFKNKLSATYTIPDEDVTIYAKWNRVLKISFATMSGAFPNGTTIPATFNMDAVFNNGSASPLVPNPVLEDYTFKGWEYNGKIYTKAEEALDNQTLVAVYKENPTVVFEAASTGKVIKNGSAQSSSSMTVKCADGAKLTVDANGVATLVVDGASTTFTANTTEKKDFTGWKFYDRDGAEVAAATLSTNGVTGYIKAVAQYQPWPTLTLHLDGGTYTKSKTEVYTNEYKVAVSKNTGVTLPTTANMSKTDNGGTKYDFREWYTDSSLAAKYKYTGETYTVTKDADLYAKYTPYSKVTLHLLHEGTLTQQGFEKSGTDYIGQFSLGTGNITLPTSVNYGNKYDFFGWTQYESNQASQAVVPSVVSFDNSNNPIDEEFYAYTRGKVYFKPRTSTFPVTLSDYGTPNSDGYYSAYLDDNNKVTLPDGSKLIKDSKYTNILRGWYDENGKQVNNGDVLEPGTKLQAKWSKIWFRVVFHTPFETSYVSVCKVEEDNNGKNLNVFTNDSGVQVNHYTALPAHGIWQSDGWYQFGDLGSDSPTIAADGTIRKEISTENTKLEDIGDGTKENTIHLYAKWKATVFVKASGFTNGGKYLLTDVDSNKASVAYQSGDRVKYTSGVSANTLNTLYGSFNYINASGTTQAIDTKNLNTTYQWIAEAKGSDFYLKNAYSGGYMYMDSKTDYVDGFWYRRIRINSSVTGDAKWNYKDGSTSYIYNLEGKRWIRFSSDGELRANTNYKSTLYESKTIYCHSPQQ